MKETKQSQSPLRFELRGDENHIIDEIKKYIPIEREDIWSWVCYFQNEVQDYNKKNTKKNNKPSRAELQTRKSVYRICREAEEEGALVSMTNIVTPNRTELNEKLRLYFKQTFPRFDPIVDEEAAEDILFRVNAYLQGTYMKGTNIQFPLSSGTNMHLIPITFNLQLLITVIDEYYGDGEYTKHLDINHFIINEQTTEDDVDKLIDFVRSYLI